RRGKRHRARAGEVSVLSGAPYGYRYIRKSEDAPASYAVIESEARVVREGYAHYTATGGSIGAITRWLNAGGGPTRKAGTRWERSTVWAILRNPSDKGTACFGKTRVATRQRVTRRLRLRGGHATRDSANRERPREEWIEIPVPALIDEATFARAQELLHENKVRAPRRTITPSLVQGMVSCHRCGYALSRASTRSSARRIHYYRCIGSDSWRHLGGPRCNSRPVRQDLLDAIVWAEVMRLLEDPTLIQQELDRRLAAARAADPTRQREQTLQRALVRVRKSIERVLTAYQEDLLSLEQLRERMPSLRQRERALRMELQSIADQTRERATYLHLAETLSAFLARLRDSANTLDVVERQRIVRLVIKEVLVGDDTIVIRHCIPVPSGPSNESGPQESDSSTHGGKSRSYLLCTGSNHAPLRRAARPLFQGAIRPLHRRTYPAPDVQPDPWNVGVVCHGAFHQLMIQTVEKTFDVQINDPGGLPASLPRHPHRVECRFAGSIAVGVRVEHGFHQRLQDHSHDCLTHSVGYRGNAQRTRAAVILLYLDEAYGWRKVRARRHPI